MALSPAVVRGFAERLDAARRNRAPVAPLSDAAPGMTMEDGYEVQRALTAARTRAGERVAGWKVGMTSAGPRAAFGIDEAVCGPVFASAVRASGAAVEMGALIAPVAEVEVAVVMRRRLAGPGVSLGGAALAVEGAMAAIEVVDCRYVDWKFKGPDLLADGVGNVGLVLGARLVPLRRLDLLLEGVVWEQDGEVVGTGTAAEVIGGPLTSVAWLANRLGAWGLALEPGDLVSTGSLSKVLRPRRGQSARATFTRLGAVSARFL